MKIKPPGQGIDPPTEFPDDSAPPPRPPGRAGPLLPPVTQESGVSPPALARLPPSSGAFTTTDLQEVMNKLDAATIPVLLLDRLRSLAAAPSPHAYTLNQALKGLETIARGPQPGVPEPVWLTFEPWDSDAPLPAVEWLARAGEALGFARDPLADQLSERLTAGGMDALEAAHLGHQTAGVVLAVQWVWARNGDLPATGVDPLAKAWQGPLQDLQQIVGEARRVLEWHANDLRPPEPPLLRV